MSSYTVSHLTDFGVLCRDHHLFRRLDPRLVELPLLDGRKYSLHFEYCVHFLRRSIFELYNVSRNQNAICGVERIENFRRDIRAETRITRNLS